MFRLSSGLISPPSLPHYISVVKYAWSKQWSHDIIDANIHTNKLTKIEIKLQSLHQCKLPAQETQSLIPLENSVLLLPVCWLKKALAVNQSVFTFIFQSLEFLWNNKDFAALTASSINLREIFKLFTLEIRRTSSIFN